MFTLHNTKRAALVLLIFGLLPVAQIGCDKNQERSIVASSPNITTIPVDSIPSRKDAQVSTAALAYPPMSVYLNVPWVYQILPGSTDTKTCGQACAAMLGGYFNYVAISQQTIINENNWLNGLFPGLGYNTPNSYYTNFSAPRYALSRLLHEYHGLQFGVMSGNHADAIVNELVKGHPVIAGVMISGGDLVASGGQSHWVLVIGWDGTKLILNDPGTDRGFRRGAGIRYSIAAFEASWATTGNTFAPVWK